MSSSQMPPTRAVTLVGMAVVVAALYFARTVCIPLALAILLSFLLAPLVMRLRHWGIGRITSVITAGTLAFVVVGALGWLMATQFYDLAAKLPEYESTIQRKVHSFAKADGGVFGKSRHLLRRVDREFTSAGKRASESDDTGTRTNTAASKPIPVEIHRPEATSVQIFRDLLKSLANPLVTAGIVIVFVIFMLVNREDLRDRLIRLLGADQLNLTTQALDDAAQRVSRFLLTQLAINLCYGVPVAVALFFIGVPNPVLWGLMAAVLRFIPYVGIWIAAAMPAALALAVDPGWSKLLETAGVFIAMEIITYNFIEPWLYGACTGISSIAILVAAVFWTWLWGPIGLLLSTPLTVCLVVLGRYVPHLEFLSVLLGDEPVLAPEARLYQRLLAMDGEDASDLIEEFRSEHSVLEVCEQLLLPALTLAEEDRQRGVLDPERQRFVLDATRGLMQEISEEKGNGTPVAAPSTDVEPVSVLCLPASDEADELAGLMLAKLLAERGVKVKTAGAASLASEYLGLVEEERVNLVCISALPPGALTPAKYLCKRLRAELPEVRIIIGFWQRDADLKRVQQRIGSLADGIVTSLHQALEQISPMATTTEQTRPTTLIPANEEQRLRKLHESGLLGAGLEEVFDRATKELAGVFNVDMAAVALIDESHVIWKSHFGLAESFADDKIERQNAPCSYVVAQNELVVVNDASKDPRFSKNPLFREHGIRFYAGAPLQMGHGLPVGALSLMDHQTRRLSERELALLRLIARQLMEEVQLRLGEHGSSRERHRQAAEALG